MRIARTLAIVLAGGKGSRLGSLTDDTVKPALPFAGPYRLIDIALSNLAHSHISDVWIAEQYLPHSLNDHLAQGRPWDLDRLHGGLQVLAPFEGATGEGMAKGNSDTLWRHRERIRSFGADHVLVLSADHVYTLDFLEVMATHTTSDADLTVVTTRVDEDPSSFSVVQVDDSGRVIDFDYKPDEPQGNLVAAEVFLYRAQTLLDALDELGGKTGGLGDYGEDLLPHLVSTRLVVEHRLDGYWWSTASCCTAPTSAPASNSCAASWRPAPAWSGAPAAARRTASRSSARRHDHRSGLTCWTDGARPGTIRSWMSNSPRSGTSWRPTTPTASCPRPCSASCPSAWSPGTSGAAPR